MVRRKYRKLNKGQFVELLYIQQTCVHKIGSNCVDKYSKNLVREYVHKSQRDDGNFIKIPLPYRLLRRRMDVIYFVDRRGSLFPPK